MTSFKYTFRNKGLSEYNDDVFESPSFELINNEYKFLINPSSTTKFWRFGIVLSKTKEFEFYPNSGRYNNENLKFIEINVGHKPNGTWESPNLIALQSYYIEGFVGKSKIKLDYVENAEVEITLRPDPSRGVFASYKSENVTDFEYYPISDYQYFKISAWADGIDFEIDCTITVTNIFDKAIESSAKASNYWLLKLSPESWVIENFRVGNTEEFSTHKYSLTEPDMIIRQRPEYELYFKINQGDKVIGYAYKNHDAAVCLFDVISPVHVNNFQREIINIKVSKVFEPKIPLDLFRNKITFENELNEVSEIRLIEITKEIYEAIISIDPTHKQEIKTDPDIKSRLHSDTYDFDEADILNYDLIAENLFTILTNKDTNPPLNIGILAPWGRGKTTLMKRIKKRFDDLRIQEFPTKQAEEKIKFSIRHFGKWLKNKFVNKIYNIPSVATLMNWLKTDKLEIKFTVPHATVWFNPWNYQSSEMIWGGLAFALIEQVVSQIPSSAERELFRLQLRLARMDKEELRKDIQNYFIQLIAFIFLFGSISLIFFILFFSKNFNIWFGIFGGLSLMSTLPPIYKFSQRNSKSLVKKLSKYDKPLQYLNKLGTFHEVEADLKKVFDSLIKKDQPLTVFVDDLDRCSPSKVVEVVEAINVFINSDAYKDKCYFILGMDAEMVAAALDVSYENMRGKMGSRELEQGSIGWYFLDKFIQLPFFIPVISELKKKEYLNHLLSENILPDTKASTNKDANKKKIEEVFKKVMATNDSQQSSEVIKKASLTSDEEKELDKKILKNQVESTQQGEEIKKQVSEYAQFINSDPRSLKRFTNLLRFYSSYQFIRKKRNQSYVEVKVLAKWLAIMIKFPQMVRWIQWDSENKSGIDTAAEKKTEILDRLIVDYRNENPDIYNDFDRWLMMDFHLSETPKKIKDLEDMPWLKSRSMFKILMNECSNDAKFKNALACNVW